MKQLSRHWISENRKNPHDPKKKQKTNVVRSNMAAILLPR